MRKSLFVISGLVLAVVLALSFVFTSTTGNVVFAGEDVVTFLHPANSGNSSQDFFDVEETVCLTRGFGGTVYNVGEGDIKLGWGRCEGAEEWQSFSNDGWRVMRSNFGGGMSALVGHDFCFDAGTLGKWDVVFSIHKGGSREGTFEYTRTRYS